MSHQHSQTQPGFHWNLHSLCAFITGFDPRLVTIAPGDGVVIFSMSDLPLGFGIVAKSTQDCRKLDPDAVVVLHQADIGEYLRMENQNKHLVED
ncbi:hypothetical protein Goari_003164 [Gossypium aridum]|uniref:UPF0113 domain-containing protein n=1 Tax=Gossypium aridum TaxID=34290 RepID=A0A7J8YAQ7_GOSAI|nr:hypothetical protein [Gossypium aridum]